MTFRPIALALLAALPVSAAPDDLRLPTANDALFANQPEKFYMYINRDFEGERAQVWEGGCYGFVRTPVRLPSGEVVLTKFHEGIDIAPMQRDKAGNPLDTVASISDGREFFSRKQMITARPARTTKEPTRTMPNA